MTVGGIVAAGLDVAELLSTRTPSSFGGWWSPQLLLPLRRYQGESKGLDGGPRINDQRLADVEPIGRAFALGSHAARVLVRMPSNLATSRAGKFFSMDKDPLRPPAIATLSS